MVTDIRGPRGWDDVREVQNDLGLRARFMEQVRMVIIRGQLAEPCRSDP